MKVQNIVATEKYTDKQGQEKKSYRSIGKVFTYDDGGQSVLFETIPLNWDGRATFYDIKPREQQGGYNQQPQQQQPAATYENNQGQQVSQQQYNQNQQQSLPRQ